MVSTHIIFNYKSFALNSETTENLEKEYQTIFKPLIKFLFSHPEFAFSFSVTGPQLQYYKKKKSEFITLIKQLVERKQVEILGGGFYDPVLPLLYTADRNGQIDMLSAEIRQTTGKRPRGASLFADSWDSSLVNTFDSCGLEYILLDSSFIPAKKLKFLPLIMTNLGKQIEIFPSYNSEFINERTTASDFLTAVSKAVDKIERKDSYTQMNPARNVCINLSYDVLKALISSSFFENFLNELSGFEKIVLSTPSQYRKVCNKKESAYIPAGVNSQISKWISKPFIENENKQNSSLTVYDFMETYPSSRNLYNRILYVSMLVNQYKNDKMRKNSAREKLWQAENGSGLICTPKGAYSNSRNRQQAYRHLMEAEKILREDGNFKESFSCFDYNGDGIDEYVCRMQNYFACISAMSGAIQELDLVKNTGNYADNLSRVQEYDECTDDYRRGIFVDHLFTENQFEKYKSGLPAGDGIFSKVQYNLGKFSHAHHEVQLTADAVFSPLKQNIYLRKKYIVNSAGMIVQYILKNDSEKPLEGYFAVESNFAHPNFAKDNFTDFTLEIAKDSEKIKVDTSKALSQQMDYDNDSFAETIRLSDTGNGVSFCFEPNEACGLSFYPLNFKRPSFKENEIVPVHLTYVQTLYWKIKIEPGKEIEKTINFSITNIRKEHKSKNPLS